MQERPRGESHSRNGDHAGRLYGKGRPRGAYLPLSGGAAPMAVEAATRRLPVGGCLGAGAFDLWALKEKAGGRIIPPPSPARLTERPAEDTQSQTKRLKYAHRSGTDQHHAILLAPRPGDDPALEAACARRAGCCPEAAANARPWVVSLSCRRPLLGAPGILGCSAGIPAAGPPAGFAPWPSGCHPGSLPRSRSI